MLSVFEPHTEAIRKGRVVKPTEFGKLVTIQEAEHQIITTFDVYAHGPPTSRFGPPRSVVIASSSAAPPISPPVTKPWRGRKSAARRVYERPMVFGVDSDGGRDRRDGSACSSVGTDCADVATAGRMAFIGGSVSE
jgi:hypothetical protein